MVRESRHTTGRSRRRSGPTCPTGRPRSQAKRDSTHIVTVQTLASTYSTRPKSIRAAVGIIPSHHLSKDTTLLQRMRRKVSHSPRASCMAVWATQTHHVARGIPRRMAEQDRSGLRSRMISGHSDFSWRPWRLNLTPKSRTTWHS